jgi:hypothetical protein
MFKTPILFLIFNRPENTQRVFEEIRKQKPKYLFIAADGPRSHFEEDIEKCKITRKIVFDGIDWDCEVKILFRSENLGCGKAVQDALNWFFTEVEMGIIIEDDIIPDPSFFDYSALMLKKYRNNNNIFSINGYSLGYKNHNYEYGLTRYFNMWGWATWRRSNDLVNKTWPTYDGTLDFKKSNKFLKTLKLPTIWLQNEWFERWRYLFDQTKSGNIDTWDYQWIYTCLKSEGFCIRPNLNMINNIGFNKNSTHTPQAPHYKLNNIKIYSLKITDNCQKGKMRIDKKYEIQNVAEYWNGVIIDYKSSKRKFKKYTFNWIKSIFFNNT